MKSMKAHAVKEQAIVEQNPSLASFRQDTGAPTLASTVHLAPCLELMYDIDGVPQPFLADVLFAFTTSAVSHAARNHRNLSKAERKGLAYPRVFLFVHWHEWVEKGTLRLPAAVSYLGADYSILCASDVNSLRMVRRVLVLPQLGDLRSLVTVPGLQGKAFPSCLPSVRVADKSGKEHVVRRRLAVSAHPTLYVGLLLQPVVLVILALVVLASVHAVAGCG